MTWPKTYGAEAPKEMIDLTPITASRRWVPRPSPEGDSLGARRETHPAALSLVLFVGAVPDHRSVDLGP